MAAAGASAAGWEKISRDGLGNTDEATSALAGQSIVVAWNYETPGADSSEAVTFTSSLTDSVIAPATTPIVSGWSSLTSDPELVPAPDGSLVLVFAGIHSTLTGDPLTGIAAAARSGSGSWGAPVVVVPGASANYGIGGLLLADGSSLISGDCCGDAAFVFHGTTNLGDAAGGLGSVQNRTIGRDGAGNVWLAWYDLDHGVVLRQLDGATGSPLGAPAAAPSSVLIFNAGSRVALACNPAGAGCRVVYRAANEHQLLSWAPGEATPTTVATVPADSRSAPTTRPTGPTVASGSATSCARGSATRPCSSRSATRAGRAGRATRSRCRSSTRRTTCGCSR